MPVVPPGMQLKMYLGGRMRRKALTQNETKGVNITGRPSVQYHLLITVIYACMQNVCICMRAFIQIVHCKLHVKHGFAVELEKHWAALFEIVVIVRNTSFSILSCCQGLQFKLLDTVKFETVFEVEYQEIKHENSSAKSQFIK